MKKQIQTYKVREPSGHFSQAISADARGQLVFISGMTARRPDGTIAGVGDIEAQTRQRRVFVRNMEHFDRIHKVRREYFKAQPPASTMVQVSGFVSPDYLIEINAIAVIDDWARPSPP